MDEGAQALVAVVVGTLSLLLIIRIAIAFPGWVRRVRRPETRAVRVVGVGGAGSNAVDRMLEEGVSGVDFVAINTDAQALRRSTVRGKIRIGRSITGGLGSGGDPDVGRQSAEDDVDRISGAVGGADLVFVAAGLGGGTGSGAAPVVARQAREQGALTVAIVTKPFAFEGTKRQRIADEAAQLLLVEVDALITIPNDRVDQVLDETASIVDAFQAVDHVLVQAVEGILGLLTGPGLINLDFADIRAVVRGAGRALIGVGRGSGEGRAVDAARQATPARSWKRASAAPGTSSSISPDRSTLSFAKSARRLMSSVPRPTLKRTSSSAQAASRPVAVRWSSPSSPLV